MSLILLVLVSFLPSCIVASPLPLAVSSTTTTAGTAGARRDLSSTYDEAKSNTKSWLAAHPGEGYTIIGLCICLFIITIYLLHRRRKLKRKKRQAEQAAKVEKDEQSKVDEERIAEAERSEREGAWARLMNMALIGGSSKSQKPN